MMNSSPEDSVLCLTLVFALAFGSTGLFRKFPILLSARAVLARADLSLTTWLGGARPAILLEAREGPATGAGGWFVGGA